MLQRDVDAISACYARYAPELLGTRYAQEMWALYEEGELRPETPLTGRFEETATDPDVEQLLDVIRHGRGVRAAQTPERSQRSGLSLDYLPAAPSVTVQSAEHGLEPRIGSLRRRLKMGHIQRLEHGPPLLAFVGIQQGLPDRIPHHRREPGVD